MLKLLIQGGDKRSGWRYSPRKGQSELLHLLVAKLPHYVVEVNDRAVWWRVFNPEAETTFLADVAKVTGNFKNETGGSHNPHVDSLVDDSLEKMDELLAATTINKDAILSQLAGEFYKPEKLEWLGDNNKYALIYFPVLQTTRQKKKFIFIPK